MDIRVIPLRKEIFFYHEASSYVKVEKQHPSDAVNNYQHNLAENFKSPSSVQGESCFP